jgi:DMATS type aromatic prenyltransferase
MMRTRTSPAVVGIDEVDSSVEMLPDSSDGAARSGPRIRGSAGEPVVAVAERQIAALARAQPALVPELPKIRDVFRLMMGPHHGILSTTKAGWPSDVGDDHTPYELSLAFGGPTPELRILVEPPALEPTLAARWNVGTQVLHGLSRHLDGDTARLDRVAELFRPTDPAALFGLWIAASFWPGRAPELKAYLNLQAHGPAKAAGLLEEALDRLGLAAAYPAFCRAALQRGLRTDELKYFALDLAAHPSARVKVYARHHHATALEIARVIGDRGGVLAGEVEALCEQLLGGAGPYRSRPLATCWAFTGGPVPTGATMYAPLPYYAEDDREIRDRVLGALGRVGLSADGYLDSLGVFAERSLEEGVGLHSYASFKRDKGKPKVTVYLAPEVYRVFAPGTLAKAGNAGIREVANDPEAVVTHYEEQATIGEHPLFRRLEREPADLGRIYAVLANGREGIGAFFPRWLASLVARVDNDAMRTILAKQLNDELGDGDPTQAHGLLYEKMLDDLGAFRPNWGAVDRDTFFAPGRTLAKGLHELYTARPAFEGVGATLLMEVFGKQADQRVGGLLRRQTAIDPASLTWLVLHETLEEAHAGESIELARLAGNEDGGAAREAMARGAEELAQLAWNYLDDLYDLVFAKWPQPATPTAA